MALLAMGFGAAHAAEGRATFALRETGVEISGRVLSLGDDGYRVAVPGVGMLRLSPAHYSCSGAACLGAAGDAEVGAAARSAIPVRGAMPFRAPPPERIVIADRSGLGPELIGALLRGYAAAEGWTFQLAEAADAATREARLTDAEGRDAAVVVVTHGPKAGDAALAPADALLVTRPLVAAEINALAQRSRLTRRTYRETVLALDGLVMIVAPGRQLEALDVAKATGVLTGAAKSWTDLGEAEAGPVSLFASQASDLLARALLPPAVRAATAGVRRFDNEAELADAVARDDASIGVTSLAFVRAARPIGVVETCGIVSSPSAFAVQSEDYTLARRVSLHAVVGAPTTVLARFLAFAVSEAAQPLMREVRLVDQSIGRKPVHELILRSVPGHRAAPSDIEIRSLAALLERAKGAERLSLTFRFLASSADLDSKARQDVVRLKAWLARPENAGRRLLFAGFSDASGTPDSNLALSQRRAEQVKALFADVPENGVRLASDGFGQLNPVACNDTLEARRRNRRVEVWLLPEAGDAEGPAARRAGLDGGQR